MRVDIEHKPELGAVVFRWSENCDTDAWPLVSTVEVRHLRMPVDEAAAQVVGALLFASYCGELLEFGQARIGLDHLNAVKAIVPLAHDVYPVDSRNRTVGLGRDTIIVAPAAIRSTPFRDGAIGEPARLVTWSGDFVDFASRQPRRHVEGQIFTNARLVADEATVSVAVGMLVGGRDLMDLHVACRDAAGARAVARIGEALEGIGIKTTAIADGHAPATARANGGNSETSGAVRAYLSRDGLAKYPFLFIVSYGRSGSTLLTGLLNTLPGYQINGENEGALVALFKAVESLRYARNMYSRRNDSSEKPWFGASRISPDDFAREGIDAFFSAVLRPSGSARAVGFKEIRHTERHLNEKGLVAYLDFLTASFPGAALVFNVRNVVDTARSGWWRKSDQGQVEGNLQRLRDRMTDYAQANPKNTFVFDYDSLMADAGYFARLCDFLGEKHDPGAVAAVLAIPHSYQPPPAGGDDATSLPRSEQV